MIEKVSDSTDHCNELDSFLRKITGPQCSFFLHLFTGEELVNCSMPPTVVEQDISIGSLPRCGHYAPKDTALFNGVVIPEDFNPA
jgi:hypothetical protein